MPDGVVALFLRRRAASTAATTRLLSGVVGASAAAARITATADNGLVGFQKAAQRPGWVFAQSVSQLVAILRDAR